MGDLVRIDFEERDQMWIVTLWDAGLRAAPGEPFPASGHERYPKLEQVLGRLETLGYRAVNIPYNRPNATRYSFEVKALKSC